MSSGVQDFENRKKDHIRFALDQVSQGRGPADFDHIALNHLALPEMDFSDVQLETELLGQQFSSPHFISSMTAGHADSLKINLHLAGAAAKLNWLMAVGSQRRELQENQASREWLRVKEKHPGVQLVSNIGVSEVITEPTEKILRLTEDMSALGLIIHLNPLQEVIQNRRNGNFKGGLKAIEKIVSRAHCPIIVKEVGFGIAPELVKSLFEIGVHAVDLSGRGGTHWGMVEAARKDDAGYDLAFADAFASWGYSSVELLHGLQGLVKNHSIWASGGVRSGVDSAKCLAFGARAVGVAQPLMKAAVSGPDEVVQVMRRFDDQLKLAMFCTGVEKCEDFLKKKVWRWLK